MLQINILFFSLCLIFGCSETKSVKNNGENKNPPPTSNNPPIQTNADVENKTIQTTNPVNTNQVDTNQVDTNQVNTNQVDTNQVNTNQLNTNQVNTNQVNTTPATNNTFSSDPVSCNSGIINIKNRKVLLGVPTQLNVKKPLIILLHGSGDSMQNFCQADGGICSKLNSKGAVTVAPSTNSGWQMAMPSAFQSPDFDFFDAIIDEVTKSCSLLNNVYLVGHSLGGNVGFQYSMLRKNKIKASVITSASDPFKGTVEYPQATSSPFTAFYFIIGTSDFMYTATKDGIVRLKSWGNYTIDFTDFNGGHGGLPKGHIEAMWAFLISK